MVERDVDASPLNRVTATRLPDRALLQKYTWIDGGYTDCYAIDIGVAATHAAYVANFYTTWLFKLERAALRLLASRPSTDQQARDFADGTSDCFAAWSVEQRAENQLLARDHSGRTRSWFMIAPISIDRDGSKTRTRLFFGSAVVPRRNQGNDRPELGAAFSMLLGFHKCYSRALLSITAKRLDL